MNRRQKIIVSVVGIFIVLLALVGLTYAYFLTQITGNNEDTSITVTTANLQLVYGDGNGVLSPAEAIVPNTQIKFKKTDGTVVNEKTFTVTNAGDDTEYVVIIDGDNNLENGITPINVTYATNSGTEVAGATTTFESNDFRYTITCMNGTEECNGIENEVFPLNGGIAVGNKIASNEVHTYTLTMEYLETNENQSEDMNKTFSAVINIEDIRRINPYSDNTDSLAYNIISNSLLGYNGTKLLSIPETPINDSVVYTKEYVYSDDTWAYGNIELIYKDCSAPTSNVCDESMIGKMIGENCGSNMKPLMIIGCDNGKPIVKEYPTDGEYEKTLSVAQDDYGTSYYYRGMVEDNYLNFADMCWRIVRVQGDGSTKLILDDQYAECDDITGNDKNSDGVIYTGNWDLGYSLFGKDNVTDSLINLYLGHNNSFIGSYETLALKLYNFQNNFTSEELSELKLGDWCLNEWDRTRISLKCNGIKMNEYLDADFDKYGKITRSPMYVGAISSTEAILAGETNDIDKQIVLGFHNHNSYINAQKIPFWALEGDIGVRAGAKLGSDGVIYLKDRGLLLSSRPSIVLANDTTITGTGTKLDPYVVQ